MARLEEIVAWCDALLTPEKYRDYCPNGLQVEGEKEVSLIISGVTASQALIDVAIDLSADALLVHHGFFWKNDDPRVVGMHRKRLRALLEHDVSLLAYHLPLDAHPQLGNNARLAAQFGWISEASLNAEGIGNVGRLERAMKADEFAALLTAKLGREPIWVAGGPEWIERIAWCTGAAQGYIEQAVSFGVDAYISGEISEPTTHVARECGLHYFAAGHHATERYGVQALAEQLENTFAVRHRFIDIFNPA